jgi:hypothetical protein
MHGIKIYIYIMPLTLLPDYVRIFTSLPFKKFGNWVFWMFWQSEDPCLLALRLAGYTVEKFQRTNISDMRIRIFSNFFSPNYLPHFFVYGELPMLLGSLMLP